MPQMVHPESKRVNFCAETHYGGVQQTRSKPKFGRSRTAPWINGPTWCNGRLHTAWGPLRSHHRDMASTSATGLKQQVATGLLFLQPGPRRRPEAMRAAKHPVWKPKAPRSGAKAHSRRGGQAPPSTEWRNPGRASLMTSRVWGEPWWCWYRCSLPIVLAWAQVCIGHHYGVK